MQNQKLLATLEPNDQITGFSYSFTKILTQKLRKAVENRQVFFKTEEATAHPDWAFEVSYLMIPVISYLADQIRADINWGLADGNRATMQNVCNLLATAEQFLDLFPKKVKYSKLQQTADDTGME